MPVFPSQGSTRNRGINKKFLNTAKNDKYRGNFCPAIWQYLSDFCTPPTVLCFVFVKLVGVRWGMRIYFRGSCMVKGLGNTALHECISNICIDVQVTNFLVNGLCGGQSVKADRY